MVALPELERELAAERALKRPRIWYFAELSARIEELQRRKAVMQEVGLRTYRTSLAEDAPRYVEAAEQLMLLNPGLCSARNATREEVRAWLADQPPKSRLVIYSACDAILYLGAEAERQVAA